MRRVLLLAALILGACAGTGEQASNAAANARRGAEAHTSLAANYFTRGQHAVALEELNKALSFDASYVRIYDMLGLVYMELGEDSAASENFQRALKLAPNDPDLNNNYGWFLCTRGRVADSLEFLDLALRNPLYANAHKSLVNAGVCTRKLGDETAAKEYFRKALKIQADEPQANFYMADISYKSNDLRAARAHIGRVVSLRDPSAEALWLALRIERRLNDKAAEATYAVRLKRRHPDSKEFELLRSGRFE